MTTQTKSSATDLHINLTIKRKGLEISTEGSISVITPALDGLAEFLEKAAEKFETGGILENEEEPSSLPTPEEVSTTSSSDVPVIKPAKSTMGNITSLFDTPWGRTPRTVAEVAKALEVNAVFERVEAISTYLVRLVKKGTLRRIMRDGKWAYVKAPGG